MPFNPFPAIAKMQLNHLCIILPADIDELEPYNDNNQVVHTPTNKPAKKNSHRDCGARVLAIFHHSLHRLWDSKWVNFCHHYKPRKQNWGSFHDISGIGLSEKVGGGNNPRIFSYAELYIGTNGFNEDEVLGAGGFGKVYKGVLPSDNTMVAVKCLAQEGERFEKTFAAELVAVAHLRHRNLVRLRGWCVHEGQLLLVYDYMPNLSLDKVLFRRPENLNSPQLLDWDRRRRILSGLAAALFYLHEQLETQIIHRDVKTSNVMLDSQFNARLGDFGLARWLEHELEYQTTAPSIKTHQFRLAETSRIGGTIGYLPPESFQRGSIATAKSDVFSFGIVVLEVVSGRRAVDLTYPDDKIILLDWIRRLSDDQKVLHAGDSRLPDGSYSLSDLEHLVHLGLLCTLHNPLSRPNMKWVVEALSGSFSGQFPPLPSFQSHPLYISLSSPSNTSTSNTSNKRYSSGTTTTITTTATTSTSSKYATATGETLYTTAEFKTNEEVSTEIRRQRTTNFLVVETPREISYKEIISATNNFSESNRVAELDFGTAYHGYLDNHHRVLIKRLNMKTCPALRARFSNELRNLGKLRHRNLVQLRGWCTEQGEMLVVYDYLANRLLSHMIFHNDHKEGGKILQWRHRYNIIKSIASAILYLHEEWDEQVIHRNITSSAVVLDQDMNPRLTCFALAEFLTRNEHGPHHYVADTNKSVRGIFGYMSPEYIESGVATPMADVYSFGVVVLEVVSGHMAVDLRTPEALVVKKVRDFVAREKPLEELADPRLNGEYDQKELVRLIKLGIKCTSSNPEQRPSMRQIVSILDGNDRFFGGKGRKQGSEEWKHRNESSLSLVKRMQALGIQ